MATDKKEVDLKEREKKELVIPLAVDDKNKKEINLELELKVKRGDDLSEISQAGENRKKSETDDGQEEEGAKGQKTDGQDDEKPELGPHGQLAADKNQQKKLKNNGRDEEPKGQDDKKLENKEDENKEQGEKEPENEEGKKDEDEEQENKKSEEQKDNETDTELGPQGQLAADKKAGRDNEQKESKDKSKNKGEDKNQKFKTIQEWNKFKKQAREKNKQDKAKGVKQEETNQAIKLLSFEFYRQCWIHYFTSLTFSYWGLFILAYLKYLKFDKNIVAFVSLSDPSVREKVRKGEDKTSILAIMAFISATLVGALIILIICVFIVIVSKALSNPAGTIVTAVGLLIELGIKLLGLGS